MKQIIGYFTIIIIVILCSVVFAGKDGVKKKFYPSGKLKMEASYIDGKLNGTAKFFFESGKLEAIYHFKNGQRHGDYEEYYESGKLRVVSTYINGKKSGTKKFYDEKGRIFQEINFKDDKMLYGIIREYYKSGVIKSESLFKDESTMPSGYIKTFYESGAQKKDVTLEKGKPITGYFYDKKGIKKKMTKVELIKFMETGK